MRGPRLQLPAPTLDLCLRADDISRRAAPNQELFPTARNEREGLVQLIERLQARLGPEQVQRLHPVDDHRPECGSRIEVASGEVPLRSGLAKPSPAQRLAVRPRLGGEPLQLLSGPERIDAGWWDTALAERDYFIAQAADGALVWIYRARLPLSAPEGEQGWFMQGRFG